MSNRTSEASRAIARAWKTEQLLVLGGRGTRDWTPEQQRDILEKGKAYDEDGKALEGHHMKSAEEYPDYQGDPNNIQFLTRKEHLDAHNGFFRNPTCGYHDPISGLTSEFKEDEVIPCAIIQLSDPTEYHRNLGTLDEYEKSKSLSEKELALREFDEESREIIDSILSRKKKKKKLKEHFEPYIIALKEYAKENPEEVLQWGTAVASTVINIATKSSSGSEITTVSNKDISSLTKGIIKNNLAEIVEEQAEQISGHASPVEHIVKAHGQHYGKNKVWIEKAPYSRGGKK